MADFLKEIMPLLQAEGGLSDNPTDHGGLTNYGISHRAHPEVDVKSLTPDKAAQIYKRDYWDKIGGDKLPEPTAAVAFDAAVNHGPAFAKAILIRSGGDPGKMLELRKQKYDRIVQADPSQAQFHNGWMNRLANLSSRIGDMVVSPAYADETPTPSGSFDHEGFKAFLTKKQAQPSPDAFDHEGFKAFLAKKQQQSQPQPEAPHKLDPINQGLRDIGGAVLEHSANLAKPLVALGNAYDDLVGKQYNRLPSADESQQAIEASNQAAGVDKNSLAYGGAGLATDIAGTAGAGGVIAKALPEGGAALGAIKEAIASGGLKGGNLATKTLGGAISGGAQAAMVNPDDALAGAGIGAALPGGMAVAGKAGAALGKLVKGDGVSPEVAALAKRANALGIDIPADRLVNSKPLNALAASLDYMPFSGRAATEGAMQSQLNRALSKTVGQDSDNLTQALRKASGDLGKKFDDTLKANSVKVDNTFLNELAGHEATAGKELGSDGERIIKSQIDEILAKAKNGEIDGQAAYNIKRTLDRVAKRTTPEAHYAKELKSSLMGALDRSLGGDAAAEFKSVRKQYGNMLSLEKLAKNGAEGDISAARLGNMKNINNPDLQELADISAQFLKGREGQHGAAQRAITGGMFGIAAGGVPGIAAQMAVGRGTNALLNSKAAKDYLLRQGGKKVGSNALAKLLVHSAPIAATR